MIRLPAQEGMGAVSGGREFGDARLALNQMLFVDLEVLLTVSLTESR